MVAKSAMSNSFARGGGSGGGGGTDGGGGGGGEEGGCWGKGGGGLGLGGKGGGCGGGGPPGGGGVWGDGGERFSHQLALSGGVAMGNKTTLLFTRVLKTGYHTRAQESEGDSLHRSSSSIEITP